MKIIYPNLNIFDIRCDGRYKTKEQCSCISISMVNSKAEWLGKKSENNMKDIGGILEGTKVY